MSLLSAQITSLFHNHSHTHLASLAKQYMTRAQSSQEELDKVRQDMSVEVIDCVKQIIERKQCEEKAERWLQEMENRNKGNFD